MAWRKKPIKAVSLGGAPFLNVTMNESKQIDSDGNKSIKQSISTIDVSDPANYPSFPDVDEYNDLQSQLEAGIIPQPVNTTVIHSSEIDETEAILNSAVDNDFLNTETTNITES